MVPSRQPRPPARSLVTRRGKRSTSYTPPSHFRPTNKAPFSAASGPAQISIPGKSRPAAPRPQELRLAFSPPPAAQDHSGKIACPGAQYYPAWKGLQHDDTKFSETSVTSICEAEKPLTKVGNLPFIDDADVCVIHSSTYAPLRSSIGDHQLAYFALRSPTIIYFPPRFGVHRNKASIISLNASRPMFDGLYAAKKMKPSSSNFTYPSPALYESIQMLLFGVMTATSLFLSVNQLMDTHNFLLGSEIETISLPFARISAHVKSWAALDRPRLT
ncbi:hypothetical protein WA026_019797 [Henosepilachna vigintioctopunctata]|uniref:Uncharacterized protein n=1 Tax=Henosepilachna vigintioctopunctata TaxID=420089 RepID=A0AAW1VAX5_9CUCU